MLWEKAYRTFVCFLSWNYSAHVFAFNYFMRDYFTFLLNENLAFPPLVLSIFRFFSSTKAFSTCFRDNWSLTKLEYSVNGATRRERMTTIRSKVHRSIESGGNKVEGGKMDIRKNKKIIVSCSCSLFDTNPKLLKHFAADMTSRKDFHVSFYHLFLRLCVSVVLLLF